jgi:RNA polymerase sigma factor (sigma-70 family)
VRARGAIGESEGLLRELAPRVLALVLRRFRDFPAAEDAVQEALLAAAQQWTRAGLPENPTGWLVQVASRRVTDALRAERARRRREDQVIAEADAEASADMELAGPERDDALQLLFMCCHPALTRTSAIALTLRAVGGLTTAEIANAFLVPEATMAQRISRAKERIQASGVPFQMPGKSERGARLGAVLHVLYLVFNEGYASSVGSELQRTDLAEETIRLARKVRISLPDDAEVAGLLAMMLLTDARRAARTGPQGELIPLDEQDRTKWDAAEIDEGSSLIALAMSKGAAGPYQVQAAIAALHDEAHRVEDTDWPQILALYDVLERMSDNPMVTLNRIIALAMVKGPEEGLKALETLDRDKRMGGHYRLDAVRAHLEERAGRREVALAHYRRAAEATTSLPERDYLLARAAKLNLSDPPSAGAAPGSGRPE